MQFSIQKIQTDNPITDAAKSTAEQVGGSINPILQKLENWIEQGILLLPNFILAVIFLILFILFANFVRRMLNKYLGKIVENQAAINVVSNVVYALIFITGILFALSILKLDGTVKNILAGAGIIGIALGFAFQDMAANIISGTFMAFKSNFRVGDLVQTNDVLAIVDQIDLRTTKLKTLDGFQVVLPNRDIFQKKITNYNIFNTRRVTLECGVAYDSDLQLVQDITLAAIDKVNEIRKTPSPQFFYSEFGESSIDFVVYFWVDFLNMPDYLEAKHRAIKSIKSAYDQAGINIPFPIRTLDFGKNMLKIEKDN